MTNAGKEAEKVMRAKWKLCVCTQPHARVYSHMHTDIHSWLFFRTHPGLYYL